MLLKRFILALLLTFSGFFGLAQLPPYCWQWSVPQGNQIAIFHHYIYSSGVFSGASITIDDEVFPNMGGFDVYLVKRDSRGNKVWARTLGGPLDQSLQDIAVDDQGNIYLAGTFSGVLQADGVLTSNGGKDIFIIKYTADGEVAWMKNIGNSSDESLTSIGTDRAGHVRISAIFSGTLTVGQYTLTDTGGNILSASFFASDGAVHHAMSYREPSLSYRFRKTDKYGNIYYAGLSYGPVTIAGITLTPGCISAFPSAASVFWAAKLDSSGTIQWVKDLLPCGGPSSGLQHYRNYIDFFVDDAGNFYVSFIDAAWPAVYGPVMGDPYNSVIRGFTPDGNAFMSNWITFYGYLGWGDILRYFFGGINGKLLLKNTTYNRLEYVMSSNQTTLFSPIPSNYSGGLPDTANNAFYFRGNGISKLGSKPVANAGPDRRFCGPTPSTIVLGGNPAIVCSNPPYIYDWVPLAGLNSRNVPNPVLQLSQIPDQAEYYLTVIDSITLRVIAQDTVVITKNPAASRPVITADNNTLFASAGTGTLRWYLNDSVLYGINGNSLAFSKDGKYRVKVTDVNSCSAMSDTFYAYRIVVNAGRDTSICKGANTRLGGNPTAFSAAGALTYEWTPATNLDTAVIPNPIATPDVSTNYRCIVRDSYGNNANDTVHITIHAVTQPVITQSGNVLHSGYTSGNQWFFNGQPISNATDESLVIHEGGPYTVKVTNSLGCSAISAVYNAILADFKVTVFPTTVTSVLNIRYNLPLPATTTVDIFNMSTGVRTILHQNQPEDAGEHTIRVGKEKFLKGAYLVRITTSEGSVTSKFVVQ